MIVNYDNIRKKATGWEDQWAILREMLAQRLLERLKELDWPDEATLNCCVYSFLRRYDDAADASRLPPLPNDLSPGNCGQVVSFLAREYREPDDLLAIAAVGIYPTVDERPCDWRKWWDEWWVPKLVKRFEVLGGVLLRRDRELLRQLGEYAKLQELDDTWWDFTADCCIGKFRRRAEAGTLLASFSLALNTPPMAYLTAEATVNWWWCDYRSKGGIPWFAADERARRPEELPDGGLDVATPDHSPSGNFQDQLRRWVEENLPKGTVFTRKWEQVGIQLYEYLGLESEPFGALREHLACALVEPSMVAYALKRSGTSAEEWESVFTMLEWFHATACEQLNCKMDMLILEMQKGGRTAVLKSREYDEKMMRKLIEPLEKEYIALILRERTREGFLLDTPVSEANARDILAAYERFILNGVSIRHFAYGSISAREGTRTRSERGPQGEQAGL